VADTTASCSTYLVCQQLQVVLNRTLVVLADVQIGQLNEPGYRVCVCCSECKRRSSAEDRRNRALMHICTFSVGDRQQEAECHDA
jgi:hypothetical protein